MEIKIPEHQLNILADEKDLPIITRQLCGHTKLDKEIERLPVPANPFWLFITIKLIRFYQKRIAHKLGNRCVFDPSCSHYAEMAFRKKGFFRGMQLTLARLYRCRPANGGTDVIN